ncbi:hypothetical protein BT96DRAFT_1020110, partial [Gymnopus androsaceus JB14]
MADLGLDISSVSQRNASRNVSINGGSSLRSASSMHGLLQAEQGEAMVELDVGNGTSGFKEGSRIIPQSMDSCTDSLRSSESSVISQDWSPEKASLSRHGTLLSTNATPSRNAAELKSVLGNANARLKARRFYSKLRARVEVDVIPETNIFVQGGYINGLVRIRIRDRLRKESGVFISDGKIRVVGFECIQNEEKRHTFYQQSVLLSAASPSSEYLYDSPPDNEGFYAAKEGVHVLPFSMYLTLGGGEGSPKGTIAPHNGIAVRYIVMISVKLKEIETDRRSIAHFYRDCEIWPRLNPSAILAPAAQLIRQSTAKTLFMGGSGKVGLTASLHRVYWVAGQHATALHCDIQTKSSLDVDESDEHDADACQTSTVQKQVAESILEMGQRDPTRGHAGAKGWWAGVGADDTRDFCHFLSLPSDALSIPRARLLEVAYNIRVTISAGPLSSNLHVLLPIRIINFHSNLPPEIDDIPEENDYAPPTLNGRILGSLSEDDTADAEYDDNISHGTDNESASACSFSSRSSISDDSQSRQLGNTTASDDNDDFVQQAITSLKVDTTYGERGGRFADLYYTSAPEVLDSEADLAASENELAETATPRPPQNESRLVSPHSSTSSIPDLARSKPRGPSSFAERVQQKLQAKEDLPTVDSNHDFDTVMLLNLYRRHILLLCSLPSLPSTRTNYPFPADAHPPKEIPDEVEILDEEGQQYEDSGEPRSPFAEIARKTSELSLASHDVGPKTGSRMLPTPPSSSTADFPSRSGSSALMGSAVDDSSSASDATDIQPDHEPSAQIRQELIEDAITKTPKQPATVRARSHTLSIAPSHSKDSPASVDRSPLKASVGGGNSVKDRIRMLEEKPERRWVWRIVVRFDH